MPVSTLFNGIDFKSEDVEASNDVYFTTDMLKVNYPKMLSLGLGWFGSSFIIGVNRRTSHDNVCSVELLFRCEFSDVSDIKAVTEKAIAFVMDWLNIQTLDE